MKTCLLLPGSGFGLALREGERGLVCLLYLPGDCQLSIRMKLLELVGTLTTVTQVSSLVYAHLLLHLPSVTVIFCGRASRAKHRLGETVVFALFFIYLVRLDLLGSEHLRYFLLSLVLRTKFSPLLTNPKRRKTRHRPLPPI